MLWCQTLVGSKQWLQNWYLLSISFSFIRNLVGGVIVSVLAFSVIGCGVDLWLDQTNDYKIGIYCLSAEHDELRRKGKDGLAWIRNNVCSENGFPYCSKQYENVLIVLNNFQHSQCFMRSYFVCIKYKYKYRLIFSRSPRWLKTNNVMVNGFLVRAPEGRRFLLHMWHPSCYPCYKHVSKSWMSKERIVITTNGTYQWSFVTQISRNGSPTHGDHRKTSEVMTST
jgi:hypothetical protein